MFNRISQLLKWGVARFADQYAAKLQRADGSVLLMPAILPTDFKPSIILTLSAAATYGQSGNTVTVSSAGHNGVGRPSPTDLRVFWPGSGEIPSGWYDGYTHIDANTFSFTNPVPKTVASGSAITGSAKSAYITVAAFTMPTELAASGGLLTHEIFASCDSTAAIKTVRTRVSGSLGGYYTVNGSARFGKRDLSIVFIGGRWYSPQASDGASASLLSTGAFPSSGLVELCAYSDSDNTCLLFDSVKVRYVP